MPRSLRHREVGMPRSPRAAEPVEPQLDAQVNRAAPLMNYPMHDPRAAAAQVDQFANAGQRDARGQHVRRTAPLGNMRCLVVWDAQMNRDAYRSVWPGRCGKSCVRHGDLSSKPLVIGRRAGHRTSLRSAAASRSCSAATACMQRRMSERTAIAAQRSAGVASMFTASATSRLYARNFALTVLRVTQRREIRGQYCIQPLTC